MEPSQENNVKKQLVFLGFSFKIVLNNILNQQITPGILLDY